MTKQRDRFYVNNDALGWEVINALRANAKEYNKIERERAASRQNYKPVFKSIALYGRQPISGKHKTRIPLDDARKIAVYVNPMVEFKGQFGSKYRVVDTTAKFKTH